MKHVKLFEEFVTEKKPKGAPDFHHSDAPDAEGRFRDLSIKDLAAWLIKTRKKDVKKISGSLTQQYVFNRNDDPDYAEKMQKTRKEVYKQLGREDLIDKMDESLNESNYYPGFDGVKITGYVEGDKAKLNHIEVKATQRGGGIGSKAVADFERWAKEQGAKYVEIDAYKKSINFWEKMGYELEKEFPEMSLRTDTSDGDLDKEANFAMVRDTDGRSIVTEIGFFTNREEALLMQTPAFQEKAMESIARACVRISNDGF